MTQNMIRTNKSMSKKVPLDYEQSPISGHFSLISRDNEHKCVRKSPGKEKHYETFIHRRKD